jgi:hypothetical protein
MPHHPRPTPPSLSFSPPSVRLRLPLILLSCLLPLLPVLGATLSDPQVDAYNVRVGTETFAGMYKFTTNTLLVETAQAITNMGSDVIKLYMGNNTSGQSGVTLPANVTNLMTLARDEPSYHRVFDMPFRHFVVWVYPLENSDEWWGSGYNTTQGAKDYNEIYAFTRYLLTNYNNSGKTFYLGHWEGDGYLSVNNWSTNPNPATIQGMIGWLNNRQQAVDDAKRATTYTNVSVFNYAEANRVRDAMFNGPNNNQRVINMVAPYVTNLDYLSYSSYDAQNLSAADLYTTLNYMQSMLPTNKAGIVPGARMWIGEYGWGNQSTAAQEPLNRTYIQHLLGWNSGSQCLKFILYWEMYSNFNANGGTNYCLIDYQNNKAPSWYLQHYYFNQARLLTAQFKETNGRLPTDTEFSSLVMPLLSQPVAAPVGLTVANSNATVLSATSATVAGALAQGVYGDDEAAVWVFYGTQDGGTARTNWQQAVQIGVNTHFNAATFTASLTNLVAGADYSYRFYSTNASGEVWAPASGGFSTVIDPEAFGSRLNLRFAGYKRGETLTNFPVLVLLGTNLPGFSYNQFASPAGGDLRFTDATGTAPIAYEIDEWNTNGVSSVWVRVPVLASSSDSIWAYWGNPGATNSPSYTTDGTVWAPNYYVVYHLKEAGFPYADSTQLHPALSGTAPSPVGGVIGRGCSFNGSQYLNAGVVNLGGAFTLSAWVNLVTNAFDIQSIWADQKGGYSSNGFALYVNTYKTNNQKLDFSSGDGFNGNETTTAAGAVSFGQWHQVAASVNRTRGTVEFNVDGADLGGSSSVVTGFANQAMINLGRFTNSTFYFNGVMDEARIAAGTCSSNWVWASWMTVASNTAFATATAVTRQLPTLSLTSGAGGTVLSWLASGVGFVLCTATNLTPPATWSQVTNQPALVNSQWQVALPPDNSAVHFYHLQSQ